MRPSRPAVSRSRIDPNTILDWPDADVQALAGRTQELERTGLVRAAAAWQAYDEVRRAQAERGEERV